MKSFVFVWREGEVKNYKIFITNGAVGHLDFAFNFQAFIHD